MSVTLSIERDGQSGKVLSVYYRIREGQVLRTLELDMNCMLDLGDANQVIGLEIVGPSSLQKVRKAASMYTCEELEAIFAYLAGEPERIHA
jgi:uncharacterized protein YuzE